MRKPGLFLWSAMISLIGIAEMPRAHAEDAVLVSSTVDRYVAGTVIAEGQILELAAGASATLLFRSGTVVRLKGPFEGSLGEVQPAAAATGVEGLVQSLRSQGVDVTVMGATRAIVPPSARSAMKGQPVVVDIRQSAIYCYGGGDTFELRGPPRSAVLRLQRGGSVREVAWPAGAERIAWPDDLIIEDGDRFEVTNEHGAGLVTMIFHRLEPATSPLAWIASNLLSGCRAQVEPALRELAAAIDKDSHN